MDMQRIGTKILSFACLSFMLLGWSCCESDLNRVAEDLIGTWQIDSISLPQRKSVMNDQGQWVEDCSQNHVTQTGKFQATEPCKRLIFHNTTDYSEISTCGDVHQNFTGKYYILNNPKRGLKTLALIPDIQVLNQDTIRVGYVNMDIVSIKSNKLVLISETQWGTSDCSPPIRFNKVYSYSKIK
jgi:hypothetical protein